MKKHNQTLLAVTILLITINSFTVFATNKTDTVTIKTSARCDDCKERIESRLNFTKGIKSAKLNMDTKAVVVIYDSEKTNLEAIKTAITKAGYDADEMPADLKAYNRLPKCCQKDASPH